MPALIPNLFDKYGGAAALKPALTEFTRGLLVNPSTRRCFDGMSNEELVEHNLALFAFLLGKPDFMYDFSALKNTLNKLKTITVN